MAIKFSVCCKIVDCFIVTGEPFHVNGEYISLDNKQQEDVFLHSKNQETGGEQKLVLFKVFSSFIFFG